MHVVPARNGNSSKRTFPRQVRTRSSAIPRWISPTRLGSGSGAWPIPDPSAEIHQRRLGMPEDEPTLGPLFPIDRRTLQRIPALRVQIDPDPIHVFHGLE